jgi:hypothetical protein
MPSAASSPPVLLEPLAALFLKSGVSIGGLADAQRHLALALVWAGLPAVPMSEREVNDALKARLASLRPASQPLAAAFAAVDTDALAAATRATHAAERAAWRAAWKGRSGESM